MLLGGFIIAESLAASSGAEIEFSAEAGFFLIGNRQVKIKGDAEGHPPERVFRHLEIAGNSR